MTNPRVSVITVTYNIIQSGREAVFDQCVFSVRSQSYENIEHIVIDGGSSDGTVDILNKYAQNGWISYISEPDTGIYDAMNKGIKRSSGKYIAFLNSDDYWFDTDAVGESIKQLEKSKAAFSYAPAMILDDLRRVSWIVHPSLNEIYLSFPPFNHQTMFARKDVIIENNLFNTNLKIAGDLDLIMRLFLRKYTSVCVDKIFTAYRLSGISHTQSQLAEKEAIDILYSHYKMITKKITRKVCVKIRKKRKLPINLESILLEKSIVSILFERYIKKLSLFVRRSILKIFATSFYDGRFCIRIGFIEVTIDFKRLRSILKKIYKMFIVFSRPEKKKN